MAGGQPVCPMLQRLQPLLAGLQTAEDFLQGVLSEALGDLTLRIANSQSIPIERLESHKQIVLASMRIKLSKPAHEQKLQCRAKTRAQHRCKHSAQWPTEFCSRHTKQREAHELQKTIDNHINEHDAMVRARQAKGHNHKWTDETGFQPDCGVCAKLAPAHVTASFSGQSFKSAAEEGEVESQPTKRRITTSSH